MNNPQLFQQGFKIHRIEIQFHGKIGLCHGQGIEVFQMLCDTLPCNSQSTVKEILSQIDTEGRRGKWIPKIQEYDLEIKPTKTSKQTRTGKNVS